MRVGCIGLLYYRDPILAQHSRRRTDLYCGGDLHCRTDGRCRVHGIISMPPSIESTFGQLDLAGSFDVALAGVIFSFALVSLFDSSGTMIGVTEKCGITDERGRFPRMKQA